VNATKPPSGRLDVLGIGVAVRDITVLLEQFPTPDEKHQADGFFESSGGPVPTGLVTLSRLGDRTAFCGVVGDDAAGESIVDDLTREGVGAAGVVRRNDMSSPTSVILVEGGRRTIFECWQTDLPFGIEDAERLGVAFDRCRYLLVDGRLPQAQIAAARWVRQAGGSVVLDCGHPRPGVDELLQVTDLAILSHSYPRALLGDDYDAAEFLDELCGSLAPEGSRIAGLTLGAEGCLIRDPDSSLIRVPGHRVDAIDTTGAGDIFHGAFVHALLNGDSLEAAARFANAAAALKCCGMTGRAPLPAEEQIRVFAGL
jgi:ribokinase